MGFDALGAGEFIDNAAAFANAPAGPQLDRMQQSERPTSQVAQGLPYAPGDTVVGRAEPYDYTRLSPHGPLGMYPLEELVYDLVDVYPSKAMLPYANTFMGDAQLEFVRDMLRSELANTPGGVAPHLGAQIPIPWYGQPQPPAGFQPLTTQQQSDVMVQLPAGAPANVQTLGAGSHSYLGGAM
jgi:hypothetical protein